MPRQADKKPVLEPIGLEALSDDELGEACLGNWHQLNAVLRHRQPPGVLRRLIALEERRKLRRGPRREVLARLTRALNRAEGRVRLEKLP